MGMEPNGSTPWRGPESPLATNGETARSDLPLELDALPPHIRERFARAAQREQDELNNGAAHRVATEDSRRAAARAKERRAEWPPLRLHAQDAEACPFPVDVFPAPLATFCEELCRAKSVPPSVVGPAMLAALSGAIGQSVNVQFKRDWTESALLFVVLVAEPGSAKTPTLSSILKPLRAINAELRHAARAELKTWKKARRDYHRDPTGEKDDPVNPIPKDDPGDDPPPRRALLVGDFTKEVLGPLLDDNPRGLLCDCDEAMGWIGGMNQYRGGKGNDRETWMSIWSSAPWAIDRKGGGESRFIPAPFVSVLAGMVPNRLDELSAEFRKTDGFTDRILFTFPDPGSIGSEELSDDEVSEWADDEWARTIARLFAVRMRHEAIYERPYLLRFDAQARQAFKAWYREHNSERRSPDLPRVLKGAYAKINSYCLRLTLIMARLRQCQETPSGEPVQDAIRTADVERAARVVSFFKGQARKVALAITGATPSNDATDLLEIIQKRGWTAFRPNAIDKATRRFRDDPESLDRALGTLVRMGAIRPVGATPAHGRKAASSHYEVHPDLCASEITEGNAPPAPPFDVSPYDATANPTSDGATIAPPLLDQTDQGLASKGGANSAPWSVFRESWVPGLVFHPLATPVRRPAPHRRNGLWTRPSTTPRLTQPADPPDAPAAS